MSAPAESPLRRFAPAPPEGEPRSQAPEGKPRDELAGWSARELAALAAEYWTRLPRNPEDDADALAAIAQLGGYVSQLGRIVAAMQRRMDEMEMESRRKLTISHADALNLQKLIRQRAADICAQYQLTSAQDAAAFRAAIKKAVLTRHGIRDLHDLPLAALDGAGDQIAHYASMALVMERRRTAT